MKRILVAFSILFLGLTFVVKVHSTNLVEENFSVHDGPQALQLQYWTHIENEDYESAQILLKLISNGLMQSSEIFADENFSRSTNAKPKKIVLKNGLVGLWKANSMGQFLAFIVDQALEANLTPITVLRERNGRMGTFQIYLNQAHDGKEKDYDLSAFYWFDDLIFNTDRKDENMLAIGNRAISIDHDHSFEIQFANRMPPFFLNLVVELIQELTKIESDITNLEIGIIKDTMSNNSNLLTAEQIQSYHPLEKEKKMEQLLQLRKKLLNRLQYIMPRWNSYQKLRVIDDVVWKQKLSWLPNELFENFLRRKKYILKALDLVHSKYGQDIFNNRWQEIKVKSDLQIRKRTHIGLRYSRQEKPIDTSVIDKLIELPQSLRDRWKQTCEESLLKDKDKDKDKNK